MALRTASLKKLTKALGFSLSLLICLNLLLMYMVYLENMDLRNQIHRPNFKMLVHFYKKIQLNYADVQNHMLLIERGYEKRDTKIDPVDWNTEHINWAYPPLHPTLAKILTMFINSSFWSLWIIHQIVLLSIFVGFYYWSKTNISSYGRMLSAWLMLLFFILSPLCYFINFMTLPALLLGIVFFSLRKWLQSPQEHKAPFWILTISSFLAGFSRFQGLLLNGSLLFLIFITMIWYKKSIPKTKIWVLSSANILPFLTTLGIFKYYANDPFAWARIQSAWGVHLSWPWTAFIKYWESSLVFNLFHDDLFFTGFRFFIFLFFICLVVYTIIFKNKFFQDFIMHRFTDSFVNLFFIGISFGLLILPSSQGVLLASHRLMTLAFLGVLIWFEQGQKIHPSVILFVLFVRASEFTLFFQGAKAFIW